MKIQESGENYLETILELEQKNGVVRSIDVANALGFSKPSVSRAMHVLKQAGYINQESYGTISLTDKGRARASEVAQRHKLLTRFFVEELLLDPVLAEQDACRMEHVISIETMEKLQSVFEK